MQIELSVGEKELAVSCGVTWRVTRQGSELCQEVDFGTDKQRKHSSGLKMNCPRM